jgi:hypothetical protein
VERLKGIIDGFSTQLAHLETLVKTIALKIPMVGPTIADHARLAIFLVALCLIALFIKPLLKWSIVVLVIGSFVGVAISLYFGLAFLTVLPYSSLGVSIVMLATK